jgi:transcriptional repressor NrdR
LGVAAKAQFVRCPSCAHLESRVTDSRTSATGDSIRRRRECETCGERFTTYERLDRTMPLLVKKDGRREAWDREKLIAGLRTACQKLPVPLAEVERVADEVEQVLLESSEKEVTTHRIGEEVMKRLSNLDPVAYVRFASVYRSFRDVQEFVLELERLKKEGA